VRVSRRHGSRERVRVRPRGPAPAAIATGDITMSRYVAPLGLMLATAWVVALFVLASGATS
jgi:hypothetical protein